MMKEHGIKWNTQQDIARDRHQDHNHMHKSWLWFGLLIGKNWRINKIKFAHKLDNVECVQQNKFCQLLDYKRAQFVMMFCEDSLPLSTQPPHCVYANDDMKQVARFSIKLLNLPEHENLWLVD